MSDSNYLKEIEEALKIPGKISDLKPESALCYLRKQKASSLRSLLIGESSMDPRDVDSINDEDLPEYVMKEFHPSLANSIYSSE